MKKIPFILEDTYVCTLKYPDIKSLLKLKSYS